jgi:hypothetical protein
VRARSERTAAGRRTYVSIDHLIPPDANVAGGWRVTTKPCELPKERFGPDMRKIIKSASSERGRALYCIDREWGQEVAALSYHLHDNRSFPVLITAIAMRIDAGGTPELFDQSRAAAALLKQYVHEIAHQTGRGGHVDVDASPVGVADLTLLGFRPAPKVKGLRISGVHLRQPAPRRL